jgi:hypothetical protein
MSYIAYRTIAAQKRSLSNQTQVFDVNGLLSGLDLRAALSFGLHPPPQSRIISGDA